MGSPHPDREDIPPRTSILSQGEAGATPTGPSLQTGGRRSAPRHRSLRTRSEVRPPLLGSPIIRLTAPPPLEARSGARAQEPWPCGPGDGRCAWASHCCAGPAAYVSAIDGLHLDPSCCMQSAAPPALNRGLCDLHCAVCVSLPPPMLCCPIMSASDLRYHPHSSAMHASPCLSDSDVHRPARLDGSAVHASLLCSISPKLAKAWAGAPGWGAEPSLHWLGSARGQIAVCQIACMPDRPNGASGASGANPNVP